MKKKKEQERMRKPVSIDDVIYRDGVSHINNFADSERPVPSDWNVNAVDQKDTIALDDVTAPELYQTLHDFPGDDPLDQNHKQESAPTIGSLESYEHVIGSLKSGGQRRETALSNKAEGEKFWLVIAKLCKGEKSPSDISVRC